MELNCSFHTTDRLLHNPFRNVYDHQHHLLVNDTVGVQVTLSCQIDEHVLPSR